jgi:hypothetical protein
VIEFSETNDVAAAATAVTVEEVFVGVHQEAWLVISMHRAQPHPSATAKWPRRAPILRVQIAHQGNLFFQLVESFAIHGLLASMGRIRQCAPRSQATMVGGRKKYAAIAPTFSELHNAEQAQSGRVGRARRIFRVQRCLLNGITCGDALTSLLSAV